MSVLPFLLCLLFLQFCQALLTDPATKALLSRKFDLLIIDSYFPECAIGFVPVFQSPPFMFLNTMTNYLTNVALTGTPAPWSITPAFFMPFTNQMSFPQRIQNGFAHLTADALQRVRGSVLDTLHDQNDL